LDGLCNLHNKPAQKDDPVYTKVLNEVRQGKPSKETLDLQSQRVINESVTQIFQKCKACEDHNRKMLTALDAKIETIPCVDEIDETSSTRKWMKDAAAQLNKFNKDCNLTAGLEAELVIAVGARIMLCRNIDTKKGLVNGSIGTVTAITSEHVTVKFDCIDEPCPIERVHRFPC